jgi:hypothetical protein
MLTRRGPAPLTLALLLGAWIGLAGLALGPGPPVRPAAAQALTLAHVADHFGTSRALAVVGHNVLVGEGRRVQVLGRKDLAAVGRSPDLGGLVRSIRRIAPDLVYVAAERGGLQVLDLADPTRPLVVAQLATAGPAVAMDLDRDLVWLAAAEAGLYAVDVTDPRAPFVAAHHGQDGPTADAPDLVAHDLAALAGTLFVVTPTEGIRVFEITDRTTLNPKTLDPVADWYAAGSLSAARHVAGYGNLAYLWSDWHQFQAMDRSLRIRVDMSMDDDPRVLGFGDDRLYVTTSTGLVRRYELGVPSLIRSLEAVQLPDAPGPVTGSGGAIYVADAARWVRRVAEPPAEATERVVSLVGRTTSLGLWGDAALLAQQDDAGPGGQVALVDLADPGTPQLVARLALDAVVHDLQPVAHLAYALSGGLARTGPPTADRRAAEAIRILDPEGPLDLGPIPRVAAPVALQVADTHVYVLADAGATLVTLDATDPARPLVVSRLPLPLPAHDLALAGGMAYIAIQPGGLFVVELHDPARPRLIDAAPMPEPFERLTGGNGVLYALAGGDLVVLDADHRLAPLVAARLPLGEGRALGDRPLTVTGELLWVTTRAGLRGFDLGEPDRPRPLVDALAGRPLHTLAIDGDRLLALSFDEGLAVLQASRALTGPAATPSPRPTPSTTPSRAPTASPTAPTAPATATPPEPTTGPPATDRPPLRGWRLFMPYGYVSRMEGPDP